VREHREDAAVGVFAFGHVEFHEDVADVGLDRALAEVNAFGDSLVAAGERAERTVERYRSQLEGHLVAVLGHRQIQRVNADHVAVLITMDLYVHEFETARRREQVGGRLASALAD
jgi:hypothetical protein